MNITLNLAIPAYKRPDQLSQCLESIAEQLIVGGRNITITVFDDSLTDINMSVIESARMMYGCEIKHIKNKINYGIDGNIENCLSWGESDYILVLGEDDILLPNSINEIFEIIKENEPDLIYTSYVYLTNDKNMVIRSPLMISGLQDSRLFIENHLWSIGFIGGTVINREFLNRNKKRYLGTYFNHVGRISINLDCCSKIYASKTPLVGNRSDDLSSTTWSRSYYDVLFGFEKLMTLLSIDSNFGHSFLRSMASFRAAFGYLDFHRVCLMRSYGVFDSRIFDLYISCADGVKFKFLFFIISKFPQIFFYPLRPLFIFGRLIKRMLY